MMKSATIEKFMAAINKMGVDTPTAVAYKDFLLALKEEAIMEIVANTEEASLHEARGVLKHVNKSLKLLEGK